MSDIIDAARARFGGDSLVAQPTADGVPTLWAPAVLARDILGVLKAEYRTLYDLTAIDERQRRHRSGQPASDFTLVYHLMSFQRDQDVRLKVALAGDTPSLPSVTDLWPAANWYEREVWDMFGVGFENHPNLRRILLPPTWVGHPLRKEHPARATEMGPFSLPQAKEEAEQEALRFRPEEWGMRRHQDGEDFLFLNLGPNHPSVHGVFRVALQLDGETIVDAVPDIGYHHRGAEKMGERQSWHSYIPYTDRIDYLGGVMNNLPYVLAVEKLAGIKVPARAEVIRVMLAELFRIASHLVFYGTMAQDVGALSPVFYMFTDREKVFEKFPMLANRRRQIGWNLSGGEQQLLSLAPMIIRPPRVLIADEPTLGLAPLAVAQVLSLFQELREEGVCVLLVEEKAHAVLDIADKAALLELGRITWMGNPEELDASMLADAYLGATS